MTEQSYFASSFWSAPSEALFTQKTLVAVIPKSPSWFEQRRSRGDGIPFRKIGRSCMYQKADVIAWIEKHKPINSTAEYELSASHQSGGGI